MGIWAANTNLDLLGRKLPMSHTLWYANAASGTRFKEQNVDTISMV